MAGWQDGGSHIFRSIRPAAGGAVAAQRGVARAEPPLAWASSPPPLVSTRLWRAVVNTGLCEALSDPHASGSSPACAASLALGTSAVAGWQTSGKSKETFGLRGRKSGSFSQRSGGRAAHASRPGQRSSKHREGGEEERESCLPQKTNWKEDARGSCFALPYRAAGTSTCPVSRYIWQIKDNQEDVTCSNFTVLVYQFFKVLLPDPFDYSSVPQCFWTGERGGDVDLHLHQHTAVHSALSARPTAERNSNIAWTHYSTLHLLRSSKPRS